MSFHYGTDLGAVDAESESFVPDAGADLSSSFDPAQLLFSGQQSSVPVPQHSNTSSPLVQLSLADLKQVYLEALQTYHQQVLLQAASQYSSSPFVQPQPQPGGLNLALLQLQVLAQQQLQQQQQQQQQQPPAASVSLRFGAQAPQAPMPISTPVTNVFGSPHPQLSSVSSSPTQSIFAVPRPVSEDQRAAREARIQKYRAKRLRRKNARPATSTEKSKALRLRDANGQFVARHDHGGAYHHQPHVRELENKLAHTESECEKLRQSLSSKESELAKIKHMLDEQIHRNREQLSKLQHLMLDPSISNSSARPQYEVHAMQLAAEQRSLQFQQAQVAVAQAQVKEALNSDQMQVDSYASPHSFSSTSPRSGIATPMSPATPMATSTPSAADDDDYMDTTGSSNESSSSSAIIIDDDASDDPSARAKQLLAEKLKKLGGPPSDVYYPYWPGFVMHPAFMQKEDWMNMTLRPTGLDPDVLEQERQRYFEAQRRWQQEQEEIAALLQEHPELLSNSAFAGALNWRSGYWSGNWVPAAEKIDFSKIELRKTPSDQVLSMTRPRSSTSEAVNQLQQALARRAALEAAAMSAVSSAQQAVSSSSSRSVPAHMAQRSPSMSMMSPSPRSPAMPSPMPISPQTPPSLSSPAKSRPHVPNSPTHQAPRGSSSPMRAQTSPASLIWREFLRSHGGSVQPQLPQNHGTAPST